MMLPLIKKEFRHLLPLLLMIVTVMSLDYFYYPLTHRMDEISWEESAFALGLDPEKAFYLEILFLTLLVGFSLFPREHDERTIDFLHSLPTTGMKIFLAKLSAAFLILTIGLILEYIKEWAIQLPNDQTFSGNQFRLAMAFPSFFVYLIYTLTLLSLTILVSFFRRFGLILIALILLSVLYAEIRYPLLQFLNPYHMIVFQLHGQSVLIPFGQILFHLFLSFIFLTLAYFLWNRSGEDFSRWYLGLFQKRRGKILLHTAAIVIVLSIVSFIAFNAMKYEGKDSSQPTYKKFENTRFISDRFHITYSNSQRENALPIIKEAEKIVDFLKTAMGTEAITHQIIVDLTEKSRHHAGIAGANKIRMGIHGRENTENHLRIFAHEMVHILSSFEARKKMDEHYSSVLFFEEGIAEYFSHQYLPQTKQIRAERLLAALSFSRLNIRFEELASIGTFKQRYHKNLIYPLGMIWTEALIKSCGKNSVGALLRSAAHEDFSTEHKGEAFWRLLLSKTGCELETVNHTWQNLLDTTLQTQQSEIKKIPRIHGKITDVNKTHIVITATFEGGKEYNPADFILLIRKESHDDGTKILSFPGSPKNSQWPGPILFTIPRNQFQKRKFEFQLGLRFQEGVMPYYEIWQTGMIP